MNQMPLVTWSASAETYRLRVRHLFDYLSDYATSRKVAGSFPDQLIGFSN
jgi:hypothetical protein